MKVTFQSAAAATGNGNAHSVVGADKCGIAVSGTFVGNLAFEGSVDGTNWAAMAVTPLAGGATVVATAAPGIWIANVEGLDSIRVRVSAYTSGTITAVGNLSGDS